MQGLQRGPSARAIKLLAAIGSVVALVACGGSGSDASAGKATHPAHSRSTVDAKVQEAAERAVAGVDQPVDLVAMRASSGEVLASVSSGAGLAGDDALVGRYPTGSTFKIVTAADLIEHGLSPASPASCPASITVDGRTVENFDGRPHAIADLRQAFAQSCNTAFAILGADLPGASFRSVGSELGLGVGSRAEGRVFTGTVATPTSRFERASTASDGGATVVSPLALATVAATVDAGTLHAASLTAGPAPPESQPRRLAPAVLEGLRSMMAAAVATGTASGQGLPTGTHAKTGTAERADGPPPRTVYAWLVGYRGDLAFAVLVVGGALGGAVAGPIAARFLNAVG